MFELRPSSRNERFYFYENSQQINTQTGLIGHLRGDFGSSGNEFWSDFFDVRPEMKTSYFKFEFDGIINDLRTLAAYGGILECRSKMAAYCAKTATAENTLNDYPHYGYRLDTESYTYLIRCFPGRGDYNFYVYCYIKQSLDAHLEKASKGIRFIDSRYNEKFRVEDGSKIRLITAGGESRDMIVRYINDYHIQTFSIRGTNLYHICEFAEYYERLKCKDIFLLPASDEGMTREEFIALIGKDIVVDYPFGLREVQRWSMKNFYVDDQGQVRHKRITDMLTDGFIAHCRNPHWGEATHG